MNAIITRGKQKCRHKIFITNNVTLRKTVLTLIMLGHFGALNCFQDEFMLETNLVWR